MRKSISLALAFLVSSTVVLACAPKEPVVSGVPATQAGPVKPEPAQAGWEKKWNDTLTAAKGEGTIVLYSSVAGPSLREEILPTLKSKFGINMELVIGKSDELTQKVFTERQRGLYFADAFLTGTQIVTGYKDGGLLAPMESTLILPEAIDPSAWPEGKLPFIDKDNVTLAINRAYYSYILVNTDMVKGEPKSYKDLVQPQWKGKMVMLDPRMGGGGVYWLIFMLKLMGNDEGTKFLRQVAGQNLELTRDSRLQGEWVARGKYALGIAPSMIVVTPMARAGAPIAWVRVSEGGLVHPGGSVFGLATRAEHPNAAKVLFNWLLTAEGQSMFSKALGQPASRLGISTEDIDPFAIPKPGEKVIWVDEDFIKDVEARGRTLGEEVFGPLSR